MAQILSLIFGTDTSRLKDEIEFLERENTTVLHVDMMDGDFTSNIAFESNQVGVMKKASKVMFDVHMMADYPGDRLGDVIATRVGMISIHYESMPYIRNMIQCIKKVERKARVVLNPSTPELALEHLLDSIDYVLIMTINPGTPGQIFIEKSFEKTANLKKMASNRPAQVEVDGGVNDVIAKQVAGVGTELIVVGGYLFGGNPDGHYSILWETVKQKLRQGYETISITPQEQKGWYKDEKI